MMRSRPRSSNGGTATAATSRRSDPLHHPLPTTNIAEGLSYAELVNALSNPHGRAGSIEQKKDGSAKSNNDLPSSTTRMAITPTRLTGKTNTMLRSPFGILSPNSRSLPPAAGSKSQAHQLQNMNSSLSPFTRRLPTGGSSGARNTKKSTRILSPPLKGVGNSTVMESPGSGTFRHVTKRHKFSGSRGSARGTTATSASKKIDIFDESLDLSPIASLGDYRGRRSLDRTLLVDSTTEECLDEQRSVLGGVTISSTLELEEEKERTVKAFELTYPSDGDVAVPSPEIVEYFHDEATANISSQANPREQEVGDNHATTSANETTTKTAKQKSIAPLSHQRILNLASSNLLSFDEVLIPAVAHEENEALKRIQSHAQRAELSNRPGGNIAVAALTLARLVVRECAVGAMDAARTSRIGRVEEIKRKKLEEKKQRKFERDLCRRQRKAERERKKRERAKAKELERERLRRERKKKLPRNMELWREVAVLMRDLARLGKEERMWVEAGKVLEGRERELTELRARAKNGEGTNEEQVETNGTGDDGCLVEELPSGDDGQDDFGMAEVADAIDDIALSAERINDTLRVVSELMVQSDVIRKEIFEKYRDDHQFQGYKGVKNPKALIRALAMDD